MDSKEETIDTQQAKPLEKKEAAITEELAISNMLEIETLIELQAENGIISKDKLMDKLKGRDRKMKEKRGK